MEFMAIIGFLVSCLFLVKLSILSVLSLMNNLGKYNIGGSPNTITKKIVTIIFLLIVVFLWYELFQLFPIHISII